jgi:hypothetical protein
MKASSGCFVIEQTLSTIMGRMPVTDWKQWTMDRPNWIQGTVKNAFEKLTEQNWKKH